jgi:hypothetical protein
MNVLFSFSCLTVILFENVRPIKPATPLYRAVEAAGISQNEKFCRSYDNWAPDRRNYLMLFQEDGNTSEYRNSNSDGNANRKRNSSRAYR